MNSNASGRSALIIAAGLWLCVSGPASAAEDGEGAAAQARTEAPGLPVKLSKFTKNSRRAKHASHRKSVRLASASPDPEKKTEHEQPAEPFLKDDAASSLPSSVANARAQLADADVSSGSATALTSQARARLQVMAANQSDQAAAPAANSELVAADQLNELDRALSESKSENKDKTPPATPMMAVAQAPATAAASSDDSAWGQTSFIGKIFIAFGGLLTLASAARMFMA